MGIAFIVGAPLAVSWLGLVSDVVVMVTLGLAMAMFSTMLELLKAVSPPGVEVAGGVVPFNAKLVLTLVT